MAPRVNAKSHVKNLSRWEAFLANRDEETRDVYSRALRFFCEANGFRNLEEAAARASDQHFANFVLALRDKKLAPNSVRLYATAVRKFYAYIGRPLDPTSAEILPKRRVARETNAIPESLVRDILAAAPKRKRLLFHLLWATGLRIGEALSLRKKDITLESNPPRIAVVTEKTGKRRIVFLPQDLARKLEEHLQSLQDDDYVFHVIDNPKRPLNPDKIGALFRQILQKLDKLKRDSSGRGYTFTLHSFRRSYETTLASAGVHPMVIKHLLGHSQGVEDSYLRLSEEVLVNEWKKAEKYLRLDEGRLPLPEDIKRALAPYLVETELRVLKLIENELIHRAILRKTKEAEGKRPKEWKVDFDPETKRLLEQIRRRISELERQLPEDKRRELDKWADELS